MSVVRPLVLSGWGAHGEDRADRSARSSGGGQVRQEEFQFCPGTLREAVGANSMELPTLRAQALGGGLITSSVWPGCISDVVALGLPSFRPTRILKESGSSTVLRLLAGQQRDGAVSISTE